MSKPIFYDPDRKRWKRLRAVLDIVGATITIVLVVFVFSVFRTQKLPELLLPQAHRPYRAIKEKEKTAREEAIAVKKWARQASRSRNAKQTGVYGEGVRAAYYVSWDAGSFSSLKEYHPQIDLLFPEWLHVLTPDGVVTAVTPENHLFNLVDNGKVVAPDDKVMPFLKSVNAATKVFPLVNNFDPINKVWLENIGTFLNDPAARRKFRQQIQALMSQDKYGGLNVDFEEIPVNAQKGFRALIAELYGDLHGRGLKLYINLPPENRDYDFAFFTQHVDGLILMNYDQHSSSTGPGPVASQDWFTKNVREALKEVPREKLICAIGNYGYEWNTPKGKRKLPVPPGDTRSVQEAWLTAKESEEQIELDSDSLNPHVAFMEDNGTRHDVWYLDAVTALNQMRAANQLGVNVFALWRLGSEDRSLWSIWDEPSAKGFAEKLRDVPPGQDVDFEEKGEVLRIVQRPSPGTRTVGTDADQTLVTSETFQSWPLPYQIERYGSSDRNIALTFDDGPDPKFTPQILDILKQEDVKAAFFLIGSQADKHAGLTKRIYDEGHEIGNHTFTHPDISNIGRNYMDLELNLTERFVASKLGVKPLFFRPPYSIDQEPDTADQVRPLEIVQDRGYITVGNKIDTNDWREQPVRSPDEVVKDVFRQIEENKKKQDSFNIVLMHDGGGDRTQTVKLLPVLIDALRKAGYTLVPVSQLLGKTRAEVMPAISPNEQLFAQVDGFAFWLYGALLFAIVSIFFIGDFLMTGRLLLVGLGAVGDRVFRKPPDQVAIAHHPEVAVLIPAFNEEKVIERTIRSVLHSSYPHLRVIVIDDGSTDRTHEIARAGFAKEIAAGKVLLLTKPNSGKASAANFGLRHVTEEIFVAIDADTVIHPQAIARMVPHFADARVGAIAGNAKVGNRINVWTRWQALEYITSQNFERRALNTLGAVSVVPGAIGAWRTSAVKEAGNYPHDTVAEDADLTMSLLQLGYRVHYEDRALAYTEAPSNPSGLMRQRFRWSFGILQAVWKHRGAFLRGGSLGWVALPNILIFQILLPLVSPFIDFMYMIGAATYFLDKYYHPTTARVADFERLTLFFVLFLIIDFVTAAIAFALERKEARAPEDKWLLTQVWLQRFAYRQLFSVVLFKTIKRAVDGRSFSWDKLERTASFTHAG